MIYVVGLGPGNSDYILPAAIEVIKKADIVIGAQRNLLAINDFCETTMDLSSGFSVIAHYLDEHQQDTIAVVVSGDTGFHSMLTFVKRHIPESSIEVVPGISSLQYMYGRLKKGYEGVPWISLHGRQGDIVPLIKSRTPMGILTDKDQNSSYIAKLLMAHGVEDAVIHVGERLSYKDEKISRLTVEACMTYRANTLSVVVIDYER